MADAISTQVQAKLVAALKLSAAFADAVAPADVEDRIRIGVTQESDDVFTKLPLIEVGPVAYAAQRVDTGTKFGSATVLVRFWDSFKTAESSDHQSLRDLADQVLQEVDQAPDFQPGFLSLTVSNPMRALIIPVQDSDADKTIVYVDAMIVVDIMIPGDP